MTQILHHIFYGKFYGTSNKFGCIGTPSHKINSK